MKLPDKPRPATMKWLSLNDLTVKVNFDAMFKPQNCESCSRFVIRDNQRLVIDSGVVVNNHVADAFSGKALACVQALDFLIEMGFREVVMEGDSRIIVVRIQKGTQDRSEIGTYNEEFKIEGPKFLFYFFSAHKSGIKCSCS
ncbi:hypothetical protein PVK06_012182 [Gossypium arboreum]|uniref:RNase H type-1 domain-containing protein n=1 Tax=Gossypium arboreum TaxID=29729 RepID=A0ABR0QAP1_GOSAR|nr:hypothetical protein PVK06_012182 [Gossypium arboreum]